MLNYSNITISGGVAVGKNTLFENLRPYLESRKWQFRTTGQILREYTKENVLPLASLVEDDFHRKIEDKTHSILKTKKHWVIEGWLAGFVACDLAKVLKVLLMCSNEAVVVDRVVNRDNISIAKAKDFINKRKEENFKTWRRIYGDHNFFGSKYYDIVIDTVSSGPLETVGKVLDALGYQNRK